MAKTMKTLIIGAVLLVMVNHGGNESERAKNGVCWDKVENSNRGNDDESIQDNAVVIEAIAK